MKKPGHFSKDAPEIGIGLLGLGTVGGGVARILEEHGGSIADKIGARLTIRKVMVRDTGKPRDYLPDAVMTTDLQEVIEDPQVDIVVEVIGGVTTAREAVINALKKGKPVVTANKELMASFGEEIFQAAEDNKTEVRFEASVAGGIPIIHPLKESLAGNSISLLMGIVNGTTNYIITRMEEGNDLQSALADAQRLGFAEADPSADLEGRDAAAKIAILSSIAFSSRVTPDQVYAEGITKLTPMDIEYARELGFRIKLLAVAKEENGALEVRVHPTLIPAEHPLSGVRDHYNAIFVEGDAVGELMFYGQGAGSMPTASSVVGDLIDVARGVLTGAASSQGCTCLYEKTVKPIEDTVSRYYLRTVVSDKPGVLARIAGIFGSNQVSLEKVLQMRKTSSDAAELVFVTHESLEKNIREAVEEFGKLDIVASVENIIRVEAE